MNFLAVNQERLLIGALGRISTPETVEKEVLAKSESRSDPRFSGVGLVWTKLRVNYIDVLSDDWTAELDAVCMRLSQMPMVERRSRAKDLGELMVVAHAVVRAEQGTDVTVVIDDGSGARMATGEKRRLERMRRQGDPVGRITLIGTVGVLEHAVRKRLVRDRAEMKKVYERLRGCDDGLLPITKTRLMSAPLWEHVGADSVPEV